MRRVLALSIVVVTAILLQSTVFSQVKLLGVKPELLYLVTIALAVLEGPREAMTFGFFAGLGQDFFLNQPKGITALTLTLLGYSIGLARQYIVSPSPLLPTMLVALGTFAGVCGSQLVAFLLSDVRIDAVELLRVAALAAAYGALLTPLAFPLLRRISEGSRPRRVVRF
jgi:rod shape-determining protein MreD